MPAPTGLTTTLKIVMPLPHRAQHNPEGCEVPVGAGVPAKGPGQADAATCDGRLTCGCEALAAAPSSIAC